MAASSEAPPGSENVVDIVAMNPTASPLDRGSIKDFRGYGRFRMVLGNNNGPSLFSI